MRYSNNATVIALAFAFLLFIYAMATHDSKVHAQEGAANIPITSIYVNGVEVKPDNGRIDITTSGDVLATTDKNHIYISAPGIQNAH